MESLNLTNEELQKVTADIEAGVFDHYANPDEAYILLSNIIPEIKKKARRKFLYEVSAALLIAATTIALSRYVGNHHFTAAVVAMISFLAIRIRGNAFVDKEKRFKSRTQLWSYEWTVRNERAKRNLRTSLNLKPK